MARIPSPSRGASRRASLLDELTDLFLAEGFAAFSVQELAGRLRCSKTTLYLIASSKEQIVVAAVHHFFRRSAARIEARVEATDGAAERLTAYLTGVAEELTPVSAAFYADIYAFEPAASAYAENTQIAAGRIQQLVAEGVKSGSLRTVDAAFVGEAVSQIMRAIQSGAIEAATSLRDAEAYLALADLLVNGLRMTSRVV